MRTDEKAQYELIGARIKNTRETLGIKRPKLAEMLGVAPNTLYRYEIGEIKIRDDIKFQIANILKVSVAYLMGETDDPTPPFQWDTGGAGWDQGSWENESNRPTPTSEDTDITPPKSQAAQDLDDIMRDIARLDPDLAVEFRDARKNWGDYDDVDKQFIADTLRFAMKRTNAEVEKRLKKESRHGRL